jgi:predicted MPP superfamily phosphohydrolase
MIIYKTVMSENNFIFFGCWNNLNQDNCLAPMSDALKSYVSANGISYMIVGGDNFYPQKSESDGKKTKTVNIPNLDRGFSLLPEVKIDMVFGNHDLENTNQKGYVIEGSSSSDYACAILKTELAATTQSYTNIDLCFFKANLLNPNTLILMIDTSIYSEDAPDFIDCYKIYFEEKGIVIPGVDMANLQLIDIMGYQIGLINEAMRMYSGTRNIIIVGHHPIIGYKFKAEKDKASGKKLATVKTVEDIIEFRPILLDIISQNPEANYYYLCADIHLYQKGKIDILNEDNSIYKTVHQYIVGTGGTILDSAKLLDTKIGRPSPPDAFGSREFSYTMEESVESCGFLFCNTPPDGEPTFVFNPISAVSSEAAAAAARGGRRKSKKRRYRSTKRKQSKNRRSRRKVRK